MYQYNPQREIKRAMMETLIKREIDETQWSHFRGVTTDSQITITRDMQPPPLELAIQLAVQAHEEIKHPKPGANCDLFTDNWQNICKLYANQHGGGYMACGAINGKPIAWHTSHHRVGIVLTDDAQWLLIDVAFASRKNPVERYVYAISPVDDEFNKLEMP